MINISKQFEVWVTALKQNEFRFATWKLTFFYVLSTAVILLVSSVAVLAIFAPPETELPFRPASTLAVEHSEWSLYEVREHLATVIFLVDVFVLGLVSVWSYFFARRTLAPIQVVYDKQRQFMSDVAHELRTPLAVIGSGAETMLRRERTVSDYVDFIQDVNEEGERLTRLTEQLLVLLRSGVNREVTFQLCDIVPIIKQQVARFEAYAQNKNIKISLESPIELVAKVDSDALVQIIQNLLKNAIDHNADGGRVHVVLRDKKDEVLLEVVDSGIGIPLDKQELIFERFIKLDQSREKQKGAGLGLAIVKELVQKQGGKIKVESVLKKGTKMIVAFPK